MFGSLRTGDNVTIDGDRVQQPAVLFYGPLIFLVVVLVLLIREFRAYRRRVFLRNYGYPRIPRFVATICNLQSAISPFETLNKSSVPHPCDFFLSHGWETSKLIRQFNTPRCPVPEVMINLTTSPSGVGVRPLRIVLPGGSGQVGHALARAFQQAGHQVTVLTRAPTPRPGKPCTGTARPKLVTETLEGADVCINLAAAVSTAATQPKIAPRFITPASTPRAC